VIVSAGPTTYVSAGPQADEEDSRQFPNWGKRSSTMKRVCAAMAILTMAIVLSGGLALAQGYPPGVNPSNPQDLTNRSNPQDLTLPGASNPQDLVRSPAPPKALSPGLAHDLGTAPLLSPSLSHTYTVKPAKKFARRKHHVPTTEAP
jgi:hypothetical protein